MLSNVPHPYTDKDADYWLGKIENEELNLNIFLYDVLIGGVGLSAVQGARVAGASRILVSDPVGARREAALAMGATDLLDPTKRLYQLLCMQKGLLLKILLILL